MNALLKALNLDVEYFTAISTEDYETLNRFNNSTYLQPTHKACFGAFDSPIVESSETFKLYPSKKPYCTHAYAVSAAGVLKIIKELHELYIPIDLQLMSKIDEGILKAYSVAPAAIIQTNDNPSDVSPGADFLEHQTLINSTLRSL
ncbi:11114_t:CDS:2, partial [Scutellospora calospora]